VVPPKKEAAVYLRRPELQSQSAPQPQDAGKYGKQAALSPHGVASTAMSSGAASTVQAQQQQQQQQQQQHQQQQQQPLANTGQAISDEEVSSKKTESK